MSPEIVKLYDELSKSNNHETSFLRGCIADIVRDKAGYADQIDHPTPI